MNKEELLKFKYTIENVMDILDEDTMTFNHEEGISLSEKEIKLLYLWFFTKLSKQKIGKIFNINRERVSVIKNNAISKINKEKE